MDELNLFIELLIRNTLFQSSGRGTCPYSALVLTLTALSLATHAAGTLLHVM